MQKFQYKYDGINVYLMQFPPRKRTIFVGDKSFYLPFKTMGRTPPVCRNLKIGNLSVAFVSKHITSLDQIVCLPWLPNIYSDGSVCFGSVESQNIKSATNRFWNSSFQAPYGDILGWEGDIIRRRIVGSYENWARLSLNAVCERISKKDNLKMSVSQFLHYDAKLEWKQDAKISI
jgi:hypothetical protein